MLRVLAVLRLGVSRIVVELLRSQTQKPGSKSTSTYFSQLFKERERYMLITSHHEREEEIKGSLGFGVFLLKKCSFCSC